MVSLKPIIKRAISDGSYDSINQAVCQDSAVPRREVTRSSVSVLTSRLIRTIINDSVLFAHDVLSGSSSGPQTTEGLKGTGGFDSLTTSQRRCAVGQCYKLGYYVATGNGLNHPVGT